MVVEQRSKLGGCYQLRKSAGGEPDRVHGPLTHLAPACRVTTLDHPSRVQYNGVQFNVSCMFRSCIIAW